MNVIIFGSSGMVGQGMLRECLQDLSVEKILLIARSPSSVRDAKVSEVLLKDMTDYSPAAGQLGGYHACFFCLGVSSVGIPDADYRRITYDFTLAAAQALLAESPVSTFIYVSGAGTDSSEKSRSTWARVKGATENALLALPFKAAYMFRPGYIQPLHGIKSKTKLYAAIYAVVAPLYPVLHIPFAKFMTTTEELARAMLHAAKQANQKRVVENWEIPSLATQ